MSVRYLAIVGTTIMLMVSINCLEARSTTTLVSSINAPLLPISIVAPPTETPKPINAPTPTPTTEPAPQTAAWQFGWSALEAIGTILAVAVALGLALFELFRERREEEKQKKSIRMLLRLEIESNLKELKPVFKWAQEAQVNQHNNWILNYPDAPSEIRHDIKERLEEQLELFSKATTADEIMKVNDFYRGLDFIEEHRVRIKNSFQGIERGPNAAVVSAAVVEFEIGIPELKHLTADKTVERILATRVIGDELISSLNKSAH